MHAASIIALTWAMMGAAWLSSPPGSVISAVSLAALVAVVGLPHGAADHRFGRLRLEPLVGPVWPTLFLGGYIALAAVVILGWFVAPVTTIALFFLLSAWHFGQEEPRLPVGPRSLRPVFRFARGGLVMWVPIACQADEVRRILSVVAPRGLGLEGRPAVAALTQFSWFMLAVAAVGWCVQCVMAVRRAGHLRQPLLLDNAVVASLALLLAVTSPIVGFVVYFCGWHSVRGLRKLRRELGESWSQLARSVAPLTVAALALIALTAATLLRARGIDDTLIRATFVGLSAVAIPHVVLHGIAPLLERQADRQAGCRLQPESVA